MSDPYIGEIRMFGGSFAPAGWALCQGQLMAIAENDTLFTLIGTTYGGDGQETFGLPDLQGRVPVHMGAGFIQGEKGGVEQVTLTVQQIPVHSHLLLASLDNASTANADGNILAQTPSYTPYIATGPNTLLSSASVGATGGSQPHSNMQPYVCINFIISLFGVFPHT